MMNRCAFPRARKRVAQLAAAESYEEFALAKRSRPQAFLKKHTCSGQPHPPRCQIRIALLSTLVLLLMGGTWQERLFAQNDDLEAIDFFENRIRPVLVEHCQPCHSESGGKTGGGLSLESRLGWERGGDSGPAIIPGKPAESLLIQAIEHQSSVSAMPPPDESSPLSQDQIDDFIRWIERGAIDPRTASARVGGMSLEQAEHWWSLQPITRPAIPLVQAPELTFNPIDNFVVAKLEELGLKPMDVAEKATWLRRVTLDLTGLLPTHDELEAFEQDTSESAYQRVVERLLASPAYGERYGRHWLDVARYADTAGDGADYPIREAALYRNWVIRAVQSNQPWDQFLREQIAGDLYAQDSPPEAYADLVTATGFVAIGKRFGYNPSPDFQHLDFADVIDSVGRAVLGLSIGCARCHDHKYDPVTMQDYYALYGILQSSRLSFPGGEEHKRPEYLLPLLPPSEVERLEQEKTEQLARVDRAIAANAQQRLMADPRYFAGGIDLDLETQPLQQPPGTPWFAAGPNEVLAEAQSPFAHVFGEGTRGVRLGSGLPNDGLRYVYDRKLTAHDGPQVHFGIDLRTVPVEVDTETSESVSKDSPGSYRFYLGRGVLESTALECSVSHRELAIKDGDTWRVVANLETNHWYHLQLTIDRNERVIRGRLTGFNQPDLELPPIKLAENWDGVIDTFFCDGLGHVAGPVPIRDLDHLFVDSEPLPPVGSPTPDRSRRANDGNVSLAELEQQGELLVQERVSIAARYQYPSAYGVSEAKPVNARIQRRGEPDALGDEVPRRFLTVLGGDAVREPERESGRRDLAEWLTDPSNPLTARVWVNRVWHWHFGRGLVPTTSDFGARGEMPSHPALLDWLAAEFIESGWDVQQLHRRIVLSRTYRLASATKAGQASDSTQQAYARDPENRWLWRFTRRSLDAEALRDSMLQVSHQLRREMPNQHPFPPMESWGFTIHQPFHAVYDSQHRSVYLMTQRNRRHPYLALFDGADPNQSVAERLPTTTPTQSLYLMNAPFVHRAAEEFAKQMMAQSADERERIEWAYAAALVKQPSTRDIERAQEFLSQYRESNPDSDEIAPWSALARVLITSNPFLMLD